MQGLNTQLLVPIEFYMSIQGVNFMTFTLFEPRLLVVILVVAQVQKQSQ